jgi:Ca2+-binding RTX toxin-like protein
VITAGNGLAALIQLTIDGGAGNDTITGGDGADMLLGGDGNDLVNGGRGNDVALLGAGDDTFVWNPGDGNDVVEGGTGIDTMLFNGANIGEKIDISANGERVRFVRDIANITMDVNDVEQIQFNALGGADNIVVNDLSGTDVTQVAIDLGVADAGDGQIDTVEIKGTSGSDVIKLSLHDGALVVDGLAEQVVIKNFDLTDAIHIAGLGGDDVLDASALGVAAPQITLDGGEGDDVLIGGAGNDTLLGAAGDDVLEGGPGLDVLDGGPGNNVLIQSLVTPGSNATVSQSGEGSDIFAHGQVMIEDFQASPGGAAVEGSNAQDIGNNFFPGFGAGEQMTLAPVDVAPLHADSLLM